MPTKICSFGFRHYGGSPSGTGGVGTLVIDIRPLMPKNPYRLKHLRKLRGTDKEVIEDLQSVPGYCKAVVDLAEKIGLFDGTVYLGCTGGHHRSVHMAEAMGKIFECPVEHLDIDKP